MPTISVENTGPVARAVIHVPAGGGVTVLRGRNGIGKSNALAAVESLVNKIAPAFSIRDGQKNARVDGFGATLTVGRRSHHSGDLEVESIDGRLKLADLVDPGIQNLESADAKRIKALVQLAGVEADPALFHSLLGGKAEFERVSAVIADPDSDILKLAAKIKRDIETAARKAEDDSARALGNADAKRQQAGDVDLRKESNSQTLQAVLETAIAEKSRLEEADRNYRVNATARDGARAFLEKSRASYRGPTVAEAQAREEQAGAKFSDCADEVERLETALRDAKSAKVRASQELEAASDARQAAQSHQQAIEQWEATLQGPTGQPVTGLDAAVAAVKSAREAMEYGVRVRDARNALEAAEGFKGQAQAYALRGEKLREAAAGVDEVLSGLVGRVGSVLRVQAGRLVLTTDRGTEFFAELSDGERWKLAIDIAVDVLGQSGLLVIPQRAWGELQPAVRQEIHEHAKARGVVVLTAMATDEAELVADTYEGSAA